MPRQKLTQKFVDNVEHAGTGRKLDYFDTTLKGLMLEVRASGSTYYLRYQNQRGKTAQKKLADAAVLKLVDARKIAQEKLAQIAMGTDPYVEKAKLRDVPTFETFAKTAYLPHAKSYKRSWNTDESLLRNHVIPALGDLYLDEIKRQHLIELFSHHRETHKPGSTNRVIILVRYIFNCALRWETAGLERNPADQIPLYEENNQKQRYLTRDDVNRLFVELDRSTSKRLKEIVAMLLFTGARKNEVLNAKWSDIDFSRAQWRIPFNKTGRTRHVPLSSHAMSLVAGIPKMNGCSYIFANPETKKPYKHLFNSWDTARKRAGLDNVRMHDLRHSFASFLVNDGRTLYEVQKILGHTQVKTTQRYAHLAQKTLIDAANVVPIPAVYESTLRPRDVIDHTQAIPELM